MAESDVEFDVDEEIAVLCNRILSAHDVPGDPLWHYTGADGCKGIIEGSEIFATHYGFTNDTSELARGEETIRKVVSELATSATDLDRRRIYGHLLAMLPQEPLDARAPVYLACLSAAGGDEISQWSGYGHRGAGYSLCLSIKQPDPFFDELTLAIMIVKVVYEEEDFVRTIRSQLFRFASIYSEYKDRAGEEALAQIATWMLRECASLSVRFKDKCFKHEREWRLIAAPWTGCENEICFRTRKNKLVPYVKLSIGRVVQELVCGPAHAGEAAARLAGARMLLARHGYSPDLARLSTRPFRG